MTHHIMEAIFKALTKALDQATMLEERLAGKVLSTKRMHSLSRVLSPISPTVLAPRPV